MMYTYYMYHTDNKILRLKSIQETVGNPNVMDDEVFDGLVSSMRKKGWYFEPATVWEYAPEKYRAISGHKRIRAGVEAGILETVFNVICDPMYTEEQARLDLVEANQRKGRDDEVLLKDFVDDLITDFDINIDELMEEVGFSEKDIELLLKEKDEGKQEKGLQLSSFEMEQIILDKIEKAEKIKFAFSGGKDSSLSMVKMLPLVKGKDFEAIFVSSNVEYPDLFFFVKDFCKSYNVPLKVLPAKNDFFDVFDRLGRFPDSIFRDCIDILINKTIDDYIKKEKKDCLLIRGGRKKQRTRRSKSDVYQEIQQSKNFTVKLLNPLYSMEEKEIEEELSKIKQWGGV